MTETEISPVTQFTSWVWSGSRYSGLLCMALSSTLYLIMELVSYTFSVLPMFHEECLKCGMDGYVSKPFEAEKLYREVSRFFNSPSDTES